MPEDNELDTSSEVTTETPDTPAPDTGGADFQPDTTQEGDKPATPSDWRSEKYGADWQNSLDYQRDTVKYLRGELDKAKRSRPQRRIEEAAPQEQPRQQQPQTPAPQSLYGDVQTVDEFGNRIESRFHSILARERQDAEFRSSMQAIRASDLGDPKKGIPSFSELEQEVIIPTIEQAPILLDMIKARRSDGQPVFANQGAAVKFMGYLLKYGSVEALVDAYAGKAREELGDRINEVSKEAVRVNGRRDGVTSGKLTPQQIATMSSAEFEKLVARNTGRMP